LAHNISIAESELPDISLVKFAEIE